MEDSEELKIIVIDESLVECVLLQTFLRPLSRNIVVVTNYRQGLSILQAAVEKKDFFDLVFVSLHPSHHHEVDTALEILTLALGQNSDPHRTVILGSNELPLPSLEGLNIGSNVLCEPLTREKLLTALEPLQFPFPRLNCWEYMKCGRESGGQHVSELGVCPVSETQLVDRMHGGCNGGRVCWGIGGTLCGGKVQGVYAAKIKRCQDCDFYHLVKYEEGDSFSSIDSILRRLRGKGWTLNEI